VICRGVGGAVFFALCFWLPDVSFSKKQGAGLVFGGEGWYSLLLLVFRRKKINLTHLFR